MHDNAPIAAFVVAQDTDLGLIGRRAFEVAILLSLDFDVGHDRVYLAVPPSGIVDDVAVEHVSEPCAMRS
jgi:hypothetical protein